ncbi:uncharacterized protein BN576_00017 [Alistipes sp. CAG:268]|jgi:hypothetical protein|nr:uncharacterized protein BN576_00017 [Alistipes sp. CAG:268]
MKVLSRQSPIRSGLYRTSTRLFYEPSKLLEAQITEVFDDVWPTITALKNLRWQVQGYHHEYNVATNSLLTSKFVEPGDKSNRPNLYRSCIEQTWDDQEFIIAKNLLINIFACYEAWIENILNIHRCNISANQKLLQSTNWNNLISRLNATPDNKIVTNFYEGYKKCNKNYALSYIDKYMKLLRYFKECRNCIVHCGGQTTQRVIDTYLDIVDYTANDLGIKEKPQIFLNNINDSIKLSLRGVVGFSQIILKIVSTFDIELIKSNVAKSYFIQQLKSANPHPLILPLLQPKIISTICGIIARAKFIKPSEPSDFLPLLLQEDILRRDTNR